MNWSDFEIKGGTKRGGDMKWCCILFAALSLCGCHSINENDEVIVRQIINNSKKHIRVLNQRRGQVIADSIEYRKGLEHFLVDVDDFREMDSITLANAGWYTIRPLIYLDEEVKCGVNIELPKTVSWKVNYQIEQELLAQRDTFLQSLIELNEMNEAFIEREIHSEFRVVLSSGYESSELMSFCFNISYYAAGAPHGMHRHYSFNFDKRTETRFTFNDLLEISTTEDSLLLLDVVKSSIDENGVQLRKVYEFDFNIVDEFLTFNFDAYEIASYAYGTFRIPLNRREIMKRFGKKNEVLH